ncbi:F-box protein At5g03100-like [Salvia miltiorrhiza]|uniref:F-box protein At5g03100-like n=1 Tax=Salvia miltiorrhiza TaxID=226208 RepID=UPI0025AC40A2|nr:F-box protein At5g03100-like [Salvia miltiorrhiza]XP_057771488.1 F-box protein At5g03100-like [Salvia miltiorrhiza]
MDRLSELPDSVIFHIFWFLPIWDVVRTTILSKRWKNLWTTTPCLNITKDHIYDSYTRKKKSVTVHRALLRWDGVKVLKFKVKLDHERSIHGDADLWVRFAKKHEVEELYLHWVNFYIPRNRDEDHKAHWVPQYLYSCSSLKLLSIKNCYFRIKENVQWNQLKSLTIKNGFGVTEHVISQMLCGSPQLEVLSMSFVERGESMSIRSTSLKELSIDKHDSDDHDLPNDASRYTTELRILTPNLETLEIKGIPYSRCLLMNVSSLTHATIGYSNHWSDDTCVAHFHEGLFGQILPSIQHVENVKLLPCCIKELGAMIEGCMNSSSPNVKLLRFRCHCSKYTSRVEISPLLKKLVIKLVLLTDILGKSNFNDVYASQDTPWVSDTEIYDELKEKLPMSFVLQLRTVEVTLVEADNIFPFLEFLLKNASKLEKIVFRVKEIKRPSRPVNCLLRAAQKLLKMPRSSRTAQFIFSEY